MNGRRAERYKITLLNRDRLTVVDVLAGRRGSPPHEPICDALARESSFYLAHHGAEAHVDRLLGCHARFFALPYASKERVARQSPQGPGYQRRSADHEVFAALQGERLAGPGDNLWPAHPEALSALASEGFTLFYDLAMTVLRAVA